VDPELVVITRSTSIMKPSRSSIESIAAEKAGIIKAGGLRCSLPSAPAFSVLERRALEMESPVTLSSACGWKICISKIRQSLHLVRDEEIPIHCPLAGRIRWRTPAPLSPRSVFRPVGIVDQSGNRARIVARRLERVATDPDIILDGAHNPRAPGLAAYIEQFFANEPIRIVYGAMRDKAVDEVIGILFRLRRSDPHRSRSAARSEPASIAEVADHPGLRTAPT